MGGQAGWGRGADCSRGGGEMSVGEWDIWCRNKSGNNKKCFADDGLAAQSLPRLACLCTPRPLGL